MQIKERDENKYVTLIPVGDLDANSSMSMDEKVRAKIEANQSKIHVDCSELEYISSAGLGVFISFMDELKDNGGGFVFSNMSEKILKVFQLLGLDRMMNIAETEAEAVTDFVK